MESTTRQTAFSILYAASLSRRASKNALSKLMATKYHTLSGFNRNAR